MQSESEGTSSANVVTTDMHKFMEELISCSSKLDLNKRFAANVVKLVQQRVHGSTTEVVGAIESILKETLHRIRLLEDPQRRQLLYLYLHQAKLSDEFDCLYQYIIGTIKLPTQDIQSAIIESDQRTDEIETADLIVRLMGEEETFEQAKVLSDSDLGSLVLRMRKHALMTFNKNGIDKVLNGTDRLEVIMRSRPSCSKVFSVPILPTEFIDVDSFRDFKGCYSIVRQSRMKNGRVVAVKAIDPYWMQEGDIISRRDREIYIWAGLPRNDNILPLVGAVNLSGLGMALISPWVEYGTSVDYITKLPEAPRLPIYKGVLEGLVFLHTRAVIHGDLRGSHILISERGIPMLSGFSLSYIPGHSRLILPDFHGVISYRWMAYELLENDRVFVPTKESDIWAFGMVVVELLTGLPPFPNYAKDTQVLVAIRYDRELPMKPTAEAQKFGLSPKLWSMVETCWSELPCNRSSAEEMLEAFKQAVKDAVTKEFKDLRAPVITDDIDLESLPLRSVAEGNFGEVRQCRLKDGAYVAVKTLKPTKLKVQRVEQSKRFKREVSIWAQLDHSNVLPLLGLAELPGLSLSLVSPWIETGNVHTFLSTNPDAPRLPLIAGIISGLAYLHGHEPSVIHGDLRGYNILVDDLGSPLLCDFGLAIIAEELGELPISSVLQGSGNCRWMSREMLFGNDPPSKGCDIWAFGMVVIEILTNSIPYDELKNDAQVVLAVYAGQVPQKPARYNTPISDAIWVIAERCWASNPGDRPSASELREDLQKIVS